MRTRYRNIYSFMLFLLLASCVFAQNPILNAGFENWTEETPDNWFTTDIIGFYDAVTQSDMSHSGSYAVRGEVVDYVGTLFPPYLASGFDTSYFAISENYTRLSGYYQFFTEGEDALFVQVIFFDDQDALVAAGISELGETSGEYTQFAVNMDYTGGSNNPAVNAWIWFLISPSSQSQDDSLTLGSYFLVDDLEFDNVSTISEGRLGDSPKSFHLNQNYPNPFNPSTTIDFSIPQSGSVRLTVFDVIGQEVETLIDDNISAGSHQITFKASSLPSGVYYYRLQTDAYVEVKKMMLVR